jgi:hypothetical protein
MGGRSQYRIGDAGSGKTVDLFGAVEFFDAKIRRIDRMWVDQHGRDAGAPEHRSGGRAGEATPDNRNVGVFHGRHFR